MQFPLHPLVVHFPIALITAALIFHTLHLYKPEWINRTIGLWLLGLSTIFSIVAVLSGQKEIQKAGELGYPTETLILIERHQTIGNIVVWGSILLFIGWLFLYLKNQVNNKVNHLAFAFLLLLFVIVIISGYTGGYLVYIHGVGTP
tara:strand:- start:58 stop:495 length:438 start_codon:yes stop_codon:yes gene_type:complete